MTIKRRHLSLTIAILTAVLFFVVRHISDKNQKIYNQDSIINEQSSQLETYTNRYDQEVKRRVVAEASLDEIKDAYTGEIDSIKKSYDIKIKNLNTFGNVTTVQTIVDTLEIRDTVYIQNTDTIRSWQFNEKNDFYSVQGVGGRGTVRLEIETYDSLSFVFHSKREGFLKRKHLFMDVKSRNPYTQIENVRGVQVATDRPKRLGLGIHAGFYPNLIFSVGLNYNVIQIK